MLKPEFFSSIKNYSRELFFKDLTAGIIVGIIALPLAIALAIASGVSPEKGIHTAIIAGFLISFLGGSRVQIGGPTGAFVIIVLGIINQYGFDGLVIATIMAGIMLIIMGLMKMGSMIKFIPYPITTGFTSGIAVVIFSTQVKDFLGLQMGEVPGEFIDKFISYYRHLHTINYNTLLIGVLALLIIVFWPKINKKIPGSLIAIIFCTIITHVFKLEVETIGSKFGQISGSLPVFSFPKINYEIISHLIRPAVTIAILAGIESLLSAVVADGMTGGKRHNSNTELVAQGVANMASGLFGGIPATGAIARTAANIRNGGTTPVAGMVHAISIFLIMIIFMPYASLIPLSALAAILIIVAYNMSEWHSFLNLLKAPKSDISVLLLTFFLTVLIDLVVAIQVGIVLAAFLFMKRMADVSNVRIIDDKDEEITGFSEKLEKNNIVIPKDILIYEINGPFFFGAVQRFIEVIEQIEEHPKIIILKMKNVQAMDATAFAALHSVYEFCKSHKILLKISSIQPQPEKLLKKYGFIDMLGRENFYRDLKTAIDGIQF